MSLLRGFLLAAVIATASATGAAAAVINGSDFTNGLSTQAIGGLTWTASTGTFQRKTLGTPSYTGVGITGGRTGDEIDIGETLTASAAAPFAIGSITLGVLFNGPEYGDVNEVARIAINFGAQVFTLTATGETTAALSSPSLGTVTNLSPATAAGGAVWRIDFAPALSPVTTIQFTALAGACGVGACNNQSDFTLVQMVTVPEPASLALLGGGLLGLGLARRGARGRRAAAA